VYIYAGSKVDKGIDNLNIMVEYRYVGRRVEVSSKACNFVLLQLISSPICEDSSCSISRARTNISNMLASKETISNFSKGCISCRSWGDSFVLAMNPAVVIMINAEIW